MDLSHRIALLESIAKDDAEQTKDRLKAIDQLSKIEGDYIIRSQISVVSMPTVIEIIGTSKALELEK